MIRSMNGKTKYAIPVFAAVFALMVAVAVPTVLAEGGDYAKWGGEKHFKKGHHGFMAIPVEGFVGSIQVPEEKNIEAYESLKSQITVSLGQAVSVAESNGVTDAMMASIGMAKDDDGNKYVVWTIASMDKDSESKTMTANIFVVDAGDATNFTQVSKTFDPAKMMHGDKTAKFEKFQQKFSEPTGDAEVDATRAQFLDLMQQLRDAYENGDTETAQTIKDQLKELKEDVFPNMRNPQF